MPKPKESPQMTAPRKPDKTYIGKKVTCHFYYGKRTAKERRVSWEESMDYFYRECMKRGIKI